MFKIRCYWMFLVLLCINGYQQFIPGIVAVAVPMAILLFKRTEYSWLAAACLLLLSLAAMVMTAYAMFL